MRGSSFLFEGEFEPLSSVAILAFVFSVVLFYRTPNSQGIWFYAVLIACALGLIANSMLFFYPDQSHGTTINLVFSAISMAGWLIVGASCAYSVLGRSNSII